MTRENSSNLRENSPKSRQERAQNAVSCPSGPALVAPLPDGVPCAA
jgi:hypothetical protein